MTTRLIRRVAIPSAIIVVAGLFLVDSSAQHRRKRVHKTPRITNPTIYQPTPAPGSTATEPRVVSTAEEQATGSEQTQNRPRTSEDSDPESMRRTIKSLSSQVDKLTEKIGQLEGEQRTLVDLERLSRAEQRAESLRAQLRDLHAKEAELQARAEDIEYALKPENIERAMAGYGTTHPEELREQRRRMLEGERDRVRKQLAQMASSRSQLEQAIASADAEVERLRQRLDEAGATKPPQQTDTNSNPQAPSYTPTPQPSPSPPPPQ
jgi:chromosome segregation ATPase